MTKDFSEWVEYNFFLIETRSGDFYHGKIVAVTDKSIIISEPKTVPSDVGFDFSDALAALNETSFDAKRWIPFKLKRLVINRDHVILSAMTPEPENWK